MREMRRQDRAITDPEKIRSVIAACDHCRLGFCDQERPYVVPVNFGHAVENGRHVFYFHGAHEGRKADLIRETGWACIELDTGYRLETAEAACGYAAAFCSVIGEGPICEVEDPAAKRAALDRIMAQATGQGAWTYPDEAIEAVSIFRLEAETLTGKEHL